MWLVSHSSCCAPDPSSFWRKQNWESIPNAGVIQFWTHLGKHPAVVASDVHLRSVCQQRPLKPWSVPVTPKNGSYPVWVLCSPFYQPFFCWKLPQTSTQTSCWVVGAVFPCETRNQAAQCWSHPGWPDLGPLWAWYVSYLSGGALCKTQQHSPCFKIGELCTSKHLHSISLATYWCLYVSYSPQAPFIISRERQVIFSHP